METYQKINELRAEIKTARADYPNENSLERLSDSFNIAVRDVPSNKDSVWKDIFAYFRMRLDAVYEIKGKKYDNSETTG